MIFSKENRINSKGSKISIVGSSVIKKTTPREAFLEANITKAINAQLSKSDIFYIPQIYSLSSSGEIRMEFIDGLKSIKETLYFNPYNLNILNNIGKSLATLQARFFLPQQLRLQAATIPFGSDKDCVCIHGDFNLINVFYQEVTNKIIILDWSCSPAVNVELTVGPREFDIASFTRALLLQSRPLHLSIRLFKLRLNAFLNGYVSIHKSDIDLSRLMILIKYHQYASLRKQIKQKKLISMLFTLSSTLLMPNLVKEVICSQNHQ